MSSSKKLCVVGASGLVGSHLVKAALDKGYRVKGTMRDTRDPAKAPYLMALEGAKDRLQLFNASMETEGSFDEVLHGVDGVLIASFIPTYFGPDGTPAREMDRERGIREIVRPTVDGCLNILNSAHKQGVRDIVICSSTSSTNPVPAVAVKNEVEHWSDENEQYDAKKFTSAAKTVMEKEAIKFASTHDMRLSIFLPTGLYGPVLMPHQMQTNPHVWLQRLINGEKGLHDKIPNNSSSMIHLEDLAALFLSAYENPEASGRYFGVYDSWHWQDLYAELQKILPDMVMPAPLTEPPVAATGFDFTRRDSLGVAVRDIPTLMRDTIAWIKTKPFD